MKLLVYLFRFFVFLTLTYVKLVNFILDLYHVNITQNVTFNGKLQFPVFKSNSIDQVKDNNHCWQPSYVFPLDYLASKSTRILWYFQNIILFSSVFVVSPLLYIQNKISNYLSNDEAEVEFKRLYNPLSQDEFIQTRLTSTGYNLFLTKVNKDKAQTMFSTLNLIENSYLMEDYSEYAYYDKNNWLLSNLPSKIQILYENKNPVTLIAIKVNNKTYTVNDKNWDLALNEANRIADNIYGTYAHFYTHMTQDVMLQGAIQMLGYNSSFTRLLKTFGENQTSDVLNDVQILFGEQPEVSHIKVSVLDSIFIKIMKLLRAWGAFNDALEAPRLGREILILNRNKFWSYYHSLKNISTTELSVAKSTILKIEKPIRKLFQEWMKKLPPKEDTDAFIQYLHNNNLAVELNNSPLFYEELFLGYMSNIILHGLIHIQTYETLRRKRLMSRKFSTNPKENLYTMLLTILVTANRTPLRHYFSDYSNYCENNVEKQSLKTFSQNLTNIKFKMLYNTIGFENLSISTDM
jgi:hypothetical protein